MYKKNIGIMKGKSKMMRGLISILVLKELQNGPLHGYAIEKKISEEIETKMPPGMVYVILKSLERKGCIRSEESISTRGKNIKIYKITNHGMEFLFSHRNQLIIMRKLIDEILNFIDEKVKINK